MLEIGPHYLFRKRRFWRKQMFTWSENGVKRDFAMYIVIISYFLSMTLPAVFEIYSPFDTTFSPPTKT